MKSKVKDKLVGVYAPGNYDHTSILGQTQEFSRWFWSNRKDMDLISAKLGINAKKFSLELGLMATRSRASLDIQLSLKGLTTITSF